MSRYDAESRLRDMPDHAREAVELVKGKTSADLSKDRIVSLAVARLLETIGEAAAGIRQEDRDRIPEVPWQQIVGPRNQLIHAYHRVDVDILWRIATNNLPVLIKSLESVLPPKS